MARRTDPEKPFMDVQGDTTAFTIPRRKWRELLFIGAMVPDGELFVRDPSRPLPAFRTPDLFPDGARFRVREEGKRVHIQRLDTSSRE
jgi:hypothetical protein